MGNWRYRWIKVWPWKDAPSKYKKLHTLDRQPDWVAVVSKAAARSPIYRDISWLEEGCGFGAFVHEHEMKDGSKVYFGVSKGPSL